MPLLALITLSGNTTDSTDPVTFATFGNGGAAMAYVPGKEIEVLDGETVVEYDTDGFFHVPYIINRPPGAARFLPADYRVFGEETQRRFHATENGLFLEIPEDEAFRMDGRGTFRYFTSTGVTSLLWNVIERLSPEVQRKPRAVGGDDRPSAQSGRGGRPQPHAVPTWRWRIAIKRRKTPAMRNPCSLQGHPQDDAG